MWKEILSNIIGDIQLLEWVNLIISIVVTVLLTGLALKIERRIANRVQKKRSGINIRYTDKIIRFAIIFLAVQWVVMGSSLTSSFGTVLFQGTTVLAAIAGFAAQPVLSDMICGFILSTTKPFDIGDRIELDDGTAGIVVDISIRHVTLQGIDTLKIIIPNSRLNGKTITNMSYHTKTRTIHFRFLVGLDTNVDQAKEVIQTAIMESPRTVPREGEEYSPVYFIAYEPNGILMATTVYYNPEGNPTEVIKDEVNCRVKQALDAHGIEIPYPYVHVVPHGPEDKAD